MSSAQKKFVTTSFEDFLAACDVEDCADAYDVQLAAANNVSVGRWKVNNRGHHVLINGGDATLILASPKARASFLIHLDTRYGGEEGANSLAARYEFERSMLKD